MWTIRCDNAQLSMAPRAEREWFAAAPELERLLQLVVEYSHAIMDALEEQYDWRACNPECV